MKIIAAMGSKRVIGSGAGMPWNVPEEYRQFLGFVSGQTVLMGRRSFEIFGPDLDDCNIVVVSRSARQLHGAVVAADLDAAIERAHGFGRPVFVAGGAQIYAQTLPLVQEMYLSTIKGEFEGDAYFPEFSAGEWEVAERREHERFDFVRYTRRPPT